MTAGASPLRYPGGKQILGRILTHLIRLNGRVGGVYVEPYCGGAGAAFGLLFAEYVDRLMLNDADPTIHAFWRAVLEDTDRLAQLVTDTPLTVEEWLRQREVYRAPAAHDPTAVGFATFFLNRCNRSGIIAHAGLIGGLQQTGPWKLDARFNRADLVKRIERIALYKTRITLTNLDALRFLRELVCVPSVVDRAFVYLDPPYYVKGSELYLNHYKPDDHAKLATFLRKEGAFSWVMTYDNVEEVCGLYRWCRRVPFDLSYSARERRVGREVMILKPKVRFPASWRERIPPQFITSSLEVDFPSG